MVDGGPWGGCCYECVDRGSNAGPSPAAALLKTAAGVEKGSGVPHTDKVGTVTADQVRAIAEEKMEDLNAHDIDEAAKIIAGSARSMGIEVKE